MEKQTTIQHSVSIQGVGLHTGKKGTLTFCPAPVGHGIVFRRIDVEGQPIIPALAPYVVSTARGTTIGNQGATVSTIEHSLATLRGLEIDNVLIDVDVEEVPILDGSAKCIVDTLLKAGKVEQDAEREYFVVNDSFQYEIPQTGAKFNIEPCSDFVLDVDVDYGVIGASHARMTDIRDFVNEFASCRTFVFFNELRPLIDNNLIKGGDLDNAVVFLEKGVTQEAVDQLMDALHKPRVKVDGRPFLNATDLRFNDEPVRHKLLDLIGDLALLGKPLKAHVSASRPGHRSNTEFAKVLIQKYFDK